MSICATKLGSFEVKLDLNEDCFHVKVLSQGIHGLSDHQTVINVRGLGISKLKVCLRGLLRGTYDRDLLKYVHIFGRASLDQ